MKIAIPVQEHRLATHFGHCRHFAIYTVSESADAAPSLQVLEAPPHKPGSIPKWIRQQGVDVVITGGIGNRALACFARFGIRAITGVAPAPPEELLAAYQAGTLVSGPNKCTHDSDHHS